MNEQLDYYLVKKYPKIFANRFNNVQKPPISFGVESGDGWFPIINHGCSLIQRHIDNVDEERNKYFQWEILINNNQHHLLPSWLNYEKNKKINIPEEISQVVVSQIKEKFGTLRFYADGGDMYTQGIINYMELLSETTCDMCGDKGELRPGGWIRTLCDKHALEEKKDVSFEKLRNSLIVKDQLVDILCLGKYKKAQVIKVINEKEIIAKEIIDTWKQPKTTREPDVMEADWVDAGMIQYWNSK